VVKAGESLDIELKMWTGALHGAHAIWMLASHDSSIVYSVMPMIFTITPGISLRRQSYIALSTSELNIFTAKNLTFEPFQGTITYYNAKTNQCRNIHNIQLPPNENTWFTFTDNPDDKSGVEENFVTCLQETKGEDSITLKLGPRTIMILLKYH